MTCASILLHEVFWIDGLPDQARHDSYVGGASLRSV
jgi:hypothetical protein